MDVVSLTQSLCEIPSNTNDEAAVVDFVDGFLSDMGLEIIRQKVGGSKGRDNIYAQKPNATPEILLTTHLDTVPPHIPPQISKDGKWLFGRGVCDAKGIAASMIFALQALLEAGEDRVGLLFVVGEETVSDGAKDAIKDFAPKVSYIIDGEPTDLRLAVGMKGAIVFELVAKGEAGHSAYPHTGRSAIHQIAGDIDQIVGHPWPNDPTFGQTTVNFGTIKGGAAPNVIAPEASACGIMRTTKDAEGLSKGLKQLIGPDSELKIQSISSPRSLFKVDGFDTCVVAFGCDVPHLESLGSPLLIGPGSILDAHTSHEKIKTADLIEAVEVYKRLCLKLLSTLPC